MFIDKATTPEQLVEMLKTQAIPDKDFSFVEINGGPYIKTDKIEAYINEEGVSLSEFNSNKEKVEFLMSLYYAKGIDDFKNTLILYTSDIIDAKENGEDITSLYDKIMSIIKKRYSYLE